MAKNGRRDGESVKAGATWLPAVLLVLALIAVGVLPVMLKGLYEPFTANLVTAYVASGMFFMGAIIGVLFLMVYRDLSSRRTKVYRFVPDEQSVPEADGAVRIESTEEQSGRGYRRPGDQI
jgi:hypothetical protein